MQLGKSFPLFLKRLPFWEYLKRSHIYKSLKIKMLHTLREFLAELYWQGNCLLTR
jgi:hypothetical protein